MAKKICIAIDGPAGAGKSTVAKIVAHELGFLYIDTGAMYRAIAYAALQANIPFEPQDLAIMAKQQNILLKNENGKEKVYLNGNDVTEEIRQPQVSKVVSFVAAVPEIRELLVAKQREMAKFGGVVMDGRDIGTNVLPQAELKIFLTASLEERAERRYRELTCKGFEVKKEELMREVAARDQLDSQREVSPLRKAPDAVLIDTSQQSAYEVAQKIICLARGLQQCSIE